MAEAVVGSLLFKIGSALVIGPVKSTCSILTSEASAMHNFFDEMEGIKAELESIRGFLHEAERFSETAPNIKNFIREIRRVAFDIEDIVDEFTYKLNEQNRGVVAKTIKRVTHVKTWYKLTKMLRKRKFQLGEIQKRKNEYDTSGIVKRGETQEGGRWRTAEYEHFKMEGDLTGIDENKKKLMDMLSDEESENHVISVWGMGGVGKTTLVTHVYKTVKKSFGGCAWITVSQIWERDQLLRKILQELHREDPNGIAIHGIEIMDFQSLVQTIQNYFHNKRCLLILDDVWTIEVWHCINDILPKDGFVETSGRRTHEVAEDYLNELGSRCLLQVLKTDVVKRVEICRMHDIIHSMVVSKSEEEDFFVVYGSSTNLPRGRVRRVSIQNCNMESASNNEYSLRSIVTFGHKISLHWLSIMLRSSKLLRVLDLYGTSIEKLPEEVYNLFNLHYLGLGETGIKELSKSIGKLQNLQFLSAKIT